MNFRGLRQLLLVFRFASRGISSFGIVMDGRSACSKEGKKQKFNASSAFIDIAPFLEKRVAEDAGQFQHT